MGAAASVLPVTAIHPATRQAPRPIETRRLVVVVTGAAGAVGRVAARSLADRYDVVGLDVVDRPMDEPFTAWHRASVRDRGRVREVVADADYVLHAATGAAGGWEGLVAVEIEGTRNVLDAASAARTRRVVITSSNHVAGWAELDTVRGIDPGQVAPADPVRPDGLYAAAKVFAEGLARAVAEHSGLPVSLLRIGTMRLVDDPENLADDPGFAYLGDHDAVRARMHRTWLYHHDFVRLLLEEFHAPETFRLRYATSNQDQKLWSLQPYTWTRPAVTATGQQP